jgi:hypothetical protein
MGGCLSTPRALAPTAITAHSRRRRDGARKVSRLTFRHDLPVFVAHYHLWS